MLHVLNYSLQFHWKVIKVIRWFTNGTTLEIRVAASINTQWEKWLMGVFVWLVWVFFSFFVGWGFFLNIIIYYYSCKQEFALLLTLNAHSCQALQAPEHQYLCLKSVKWYLLSRNDTNGSKSALTPPQKQANKQITEQWPLLGVS